MKKLLASTTAIALLGLSGFAQAETLALSHVRPQGATIDVEINDFAKNVEEETGGDVTVRVFPASALGDYTSVQERISVGAIDMAIQPAATGADRKMQIASFPYLASSWEQARKIWGDSGILYQTMTDLYQDQNITLLAAYPAYFSGISLNREPVNPGGTEPKGIKVRVPGIKSFQLTGEVLGYIPAPIPFSDAYTAIQTGVVDGVIGSGAEGYYASFRDVTKTYLPVNLHFEVWFLIISNESLAALDEEDQAALKKAAKEFESKRWDVAEKEQGDWEQKLANELSTNVIELSDEQISAMAENVRQNVWPQILEDVGEEWAQNILDQASAK